MKTMIRPEKEDFGQSWHFCEPEPDGMRCGTAGCGMDRGWYGIEKAGNRTNGKRQAGMQGAGVQGCGRSVYRDRAVFSDKGCWRDGRRCPVRPADTGIL